jgi:hypothetical protein
MRPIRQMFLPAIAVLSAMIFYQAYNNSTDTIVYAQESPTPVTPAVSKIKGPTQVLVGSLLFLSAEEATGDNFKWLIPPELIETSATCSNNIFFSIPIPGKYTFGLVAVNKAADIDVSYHNVIVSYSPGTSTPDVPPTTPIPSFNKVINASTQGVKLLNDEPTATALKLALNLLVQESGNKSLPELRAETVRITSATFLARKGESLKKEWGQLWVEPVDAAIVELNLKEPKTYVELLKVLVKTL